MIPMPHKADLWRPTITQATAQEITGYTIVTRAVPCFIQPVDSKEAFYYSQRGLENMVTIYTTAVGTAFRRNDILEDGDGNEYHVVGVKNGLQKNLYLELSCQTYPEDAQKRLNREDYV